MKAPKVRVHLFLDPKVLDQLQAKADERGQNLSEMVRQVLADFMAGEAKVGK